MKLNFLNTLPKILPEFFKKPLRKVYHKWSTVIEQDTIEFLKKYYNLPERDIFYLMRKGRNLSAYLWVCLKPKTEEEIKSFYEHNPFSIFSLIHWHGTSYQRNLRDKFTSLAKGRVLDYGGGVGDLSSRIYKKGLVVDYADLQGPLFKFAAVFFKEKSMNIRMINLSKDKIKDQYDTIFCIDVIEHVPNPKDLIKELVIHLKKGGQLIITALEPNISEDIPMHFKMNFNPEEYFYYLGMEKSREPFLWVKK